MNSVTYRIARRIFRIGRAIVSFFLIPIEKVSIKKVKGKDAIPCFIIGPPRSGTTFLYESIVREFTVSYFSNLANRLYAVPVTISRWTRRGLHAYWNRETMSLKSDYGFIKGFFPPSESGEIWNRWIPETESLAPGTLTAANEEEIRRTIGAMPDVVGLPFINKNVMHSVHLTELNKLFPKAIFIVVRRSVRANVRSIVSAINKGVTAGPDDRWFSVKPSGWEGYVGKSPVERSLFQVEGTHRDIGAKLDEVGPSRFLHVSYDEFCSDSDAVYRELETFFQKNGFLAKRRSANHPTIRQSSGPRLTEEQEDELSRLLSCRENAQ